MESDVRGEGDFEHRYLGASCLCDLGYESGAGRTEIFPEISFLDAAEGEDLVCHLAGEQDTVPVDENESAFDTFRDFFMSLRKYFENADIEALMEILECDNEIEDEEDLLKLVTSAETVTLSAGCYYTLTRDDWPKLLSWINDYLETSPKLALDDMGKSSATSPAIDELTRFTAEDDDDLPLLALLILRDAVVGDKDIYVAHDADYVWCTPVLLNGDVVTPDTAISDEDDYMF